MLRITIAALLSLGWFVSAKAADPPAKDKGRPPPFAELVKGLKDSDRENRFKAAEALRTHYKDKLLDALPQILGALGEELDRPRSCPNQGRTVYLEQSLWKIAYEAGPGRVKILREGIHHSDPRVRAAAFRAWLRPANEGTVQEREDQDDLLVIIRGGLKDENPLVRGQAAFALDAFRAAPPKMAEEALSLLAATLEDRANPREGVRSPAYHAAWILARFKTRAIAAIPSLAKAAARNDAQEDHIGMSCMALQGIAQADPKAAEDVVKIFQPLLADKRRPDVLRASAVQGVTGIGPAARWVVHDLVSILEESCISMELRAAIYTALITMGPRAAPVVPALANRLERKIAEREFVTFAVPFLQLLTGIKCPGAQLAYRLTCQVDRSFLEKEQVSICSTFKAIGPPAASAASVLRPWMETLRDPALAREVAETLAAMRE
jgi:hypothetical protein